MKTKTNGLRDYLKANRRASREAEIGNHDRPVSFSRVHKSKKVYDRKRQKKAGFNYNDDLPLFISIA